MKNTKSIPKIRKSVHRNLPKKYDLNQDKDVENFPPEVDDSISPPDVLQAPRKSPLLKVLVLILAVVISVIGYMKINLDRMVNIKTKVIPEIVSKLTQGLGKVKNITSFKKTSGVYEFEMELESNGQTNKYTSYISRDGKLFFVNATKVDELNKLASTPQQTKKLTCEDVNKSDKPTLTAFIVADCPYGLQMQRVMNKALGEESGLGQYFDIKYIGSIQNGRITSMHGDAEAQENLRQICIREEQKGKYWAYVSCYMKKQGSSAECLSTSGVSESLVNSCMSDPKKGLAYAQKDFDIGSNFKIESSPTLMVNGTQVVSEFDFGGRTANSLKEILCCSSTQKPGFCTKELSNDAVAASFSVTEAGSDTGAAANCN